MRPSDTPSLRSTGSRPGSGSANPFLGGPDQRLWLQACTRGDHEHRIFPGLAEVTEKIGPCPINGDITVHFHTRISPDRRGAPMARMLEYSTNRPEAAFAPLVRHAHGLLDSVEQAVETADPISRTAVGAIRRSGLRVLDGVRCTGFTTTRRTAGMDLEFQIWIDSQRGHVVRLDFRALNLADRHGEGRLNSAFGMRLYCFDPEERWVLAQQTDRVTFATAGEAVPQSGYAERTSIFHDHWVHPVAGTGETAELFAPATSPSSTESSLRAG